MSSSRDEDVYRNFKLTSATITHATATTQTVVLGDTFKKIDGIQVPEVNDGSLVTQVDLPPADGLILLRVGPLEPCVYLPIVLSTFP